MTADTTAQTALTVAMKDWRQRAACRSADPDLFFPISATGPSAEQTARAKAVCETCRVCCECLAFALATRQAHGVWGGTSEEERQEAGLRRAARPGRHRRQ